MRKKLLNALSMAAVLGVFFADDLPLVLSLPAAIFCAVEAFFSTPAGIDWTRRHKLFGLQLSEKHLWILIAILLGITAALIGPSLGVIYLLIIVAGGACGYLSARFRPGWFRR